MGFSLRSNSFRGFPSRSSPSPSPTPGRGARRSGAKESSTARSTPWTSSSKGSRRPVSNCAWSMKPALRLCPLPASAPQRHSGSRWRIRQRGTNRPCSARQHPGFASIRPRSGMIRPVPFDRPGSRISPIVRFRRPVCPQAAKLDRWWHRWRPATEPDRSLWWAVSACGRDRNAGSPDRLCHRRT